MLTLPAVPFNRSVFVVGNDGIILGHVQFEHVIVPLTSSVTETRYFCSGPQFSNAEMGIVMTPPTPSHRVQARFE